MKVWHRQRQEYNKMLEVDDISIVQIMNSVKFVKNNRGLATGNGIVFMAFLLIPVIGVILVLPLSVTAATIETVKKIQQR